MLPFFLVHDGIGIIEPLVTLVVAAALYLQVEFARRPDLRVAALLGVVLAAGLLTKENTNPAILLLPVSLICFDWARRRPGPAPADLVRRGGHLRLMLGAAVLVLHASSRYGEYEASRENPLLYTVRSAGEVFRPLRHRGTLVGLPPGVHGLHDHSAPGRRGRGRAASPSGATRASDCCSWPLGAVPVRDLDALLHRAVSPPRHVPASAGDGAHGLRDRRGRARGPPGASGPRGDRRGGLAVALLLAPALRLDARVLAHPDTARYPGMDDLQYVTGTGGGSVWPAMAGRSSAGHGATA